MESLHNYSNFYLTIYLPTSLPTYLTTNLFTEEEDKENEIQLLFTVGLIYWSSRLLDRFYKRKWMKWQGQKVLIFVRLSLLILLNLQVTMIKWCWGQILINIVVLTSIFLCVCVWFKYADVKIVTSVKVGIVFRMRYCIIQWLHCRWRYADIEAGFESNIGEKER